jgi:glycerol transport system ATP-binding protein
MNLLPCRLAGDAVLLGEHRIGLPTGRIARAHAAGGEMTLGIRPEHVHLAPAGSTGAIPAELVNVEDLGNYKIVTARLAGHLVKAKLPEDADVTGNTGWFAFPPERTRLYADGRSVDADTRE